MYRHYDILLLCQELMVDLSSERLLLNHSQGRPLLLEVVCQKDETLLKILFEHHSNPKEICNTLYKYKTFDGISKTASPISCACELGYRASWTGFEHLRFLTNPRLFGKQLTVISLSCLKLEKVPVEIFHENLETVELQGNKLSALPSADPSGESLDWNCPVLSEINIAHNMFEEIPTEVFQLPALKRLTASYNKIGRLDMEMWTAPKLEDLRMQHNALTGLPCPIFCPRWDNPLMFSLQSERSSSQEQHYLNSVRQKNINFEADSPEELHKCQTGFLLHTLDLSNNQLTEVPKGLPCLTPLLRTLKISSNAITDLGYISYYPPSLNTLDASSNAIEESIRPSENSQLNSCYQAQLRHCSLNCAHQSHSKLSQLKILYLSDNHLREFPIRPKQQQPASGSSSHINNNNNISSSSNNSLGLFFPRLHALKLSRNNLKEVPSDIHEMEKLSELAIDGNKDIMDLPNSIHKLSDLFSFSFEGISAPVAQELAKFRSASEMRYYLKALQKE